MFPFPVNEQPFIILNEVASTNNYAMARITEGGVSEGTAYFARLQTSGKGQRGKQWSSEPDENIILSLVLKPHRLKLSEQFLLSAAIALGSYDFVKKWAGEPTSIKWSNDIYWNDKKAGGILIENVIRGTEWTYAVAGIGININQEHFPPELPNPVSLRQITGTQYDVIALAKLLRESIWQEYIHLKPENFNSLLTRYNDVLYRKNECKPYRMQNEVFNATLLGVEKTGKLMLEKEGSLIRTNLGEIEFVL